MATAMQRGICQFIRLCGSVPQAAAGRLTVCTVTLDFMRLRAVGAAVLKGGETIPPTLKTALVQYTVSPTRKRP